MNRPGLLRQAWLAARRDLMRERRRAEVLWVTIPFGVLAMMLLPLAVGTNTRLLETIGPGVYWLVVLLFGVMVTTRSTAADAPAQRDMSLLAGLDPAASFIGRSLASFVLLTGFELALGVTTLLLYNVVLSSWLLVPLVVLLTAAGLALIGTLASSIVGVTRSGPAMVPLLVAPLAVPLLLGATQAVDGLLVGEGTLESLTLMALAVVLAAMVGVMSAESLQEAR